VILTVRAFDGIASKPNLRHSTGIRISHTGIVPPHGVQGVLAADYGTVVPPALHRFKTCTGTVT
jgi:hypothetical protein